MQKLCNYFRPKLTPPPLLPPVTPCPCITLPLIASCNILNDPYPPLAAEVNIMARISQLCRHGKNRVRLLFAISDHIYASFDFLSLLKCSMKLILHIYYRYNSSNALFCRFPVFFWKSLFIPPSQCVASGQNIYHCLADT